MSYATVLAGPLRACPDDPGPGVAVVLGTRPEMIKLAGVIECLGDDARVFHTGQHYDQAMSGGVWAELGLPEPERVFGVGGLPRALQISHSLTALHHVFEQSRPHTVIVQGDTNATLAGALAANAHGIRLMHVEAGLRSHDRAMPEEHNRVLVSQLADVLCAPTAASVRNLLSMGVARERIHLTGNTVVEAVRRRLPPADARRDLLAAYGLAPSGYVLATVHRPENTDVPETLRTVLTELAALTLPVVLPLHPRTLDRIRAFRLEHLLGTLTVTPPLPSAEFLGLAAEAAVLVSDSGGLQEECTVLRRPLLVIRGSTERPEALPGFSELAPPGPGISRLANSWIACRAGIHEQLAGLDSPYGDGAASDRIACLARNGAGARPGAPHNPAPHKESDA
ncbi:UDP-N-acetylglucosamine 2-epimerase (non-hydrolyzing) [Streptomyces sp. SPB4]|uniref:non-hydrolyzing UDP-N-acetylglucosamine 2-epimerase n=1 Tax=Streptomyces TaxID=1883 RepID=UPI002473D447|nr:UDP-N-acetylglucosamine 2-epimerase (non-hydrolyzing) [Streptomyces sp. SPB4]MDH6544037.1 UDP-N-acetylglucosamine 2-epimerase (non-hydrolyzing) [Streptomyces sp. SPB4]